MSFVKPAAALIAAAAAMASATTYQWNWTPANGGHNNAAGTFESVTATFTDTTDRLSFSVTFANTSTQGLTLALNDGPNPKGQGNLALLYIDATDAGNVRMNAFAYNGLNSFTSFRDGSSANGNQAPDKILGLNDSWVDSATVTDVAGKRTIAFTINASAINNRTPLYGSPSIPWEGIAFDDKVGVWLHTYAGLSTSYGNDGFLTSSTSGWARRSEGWLDGNNFDASIIPDPVSVPLPAPVWAGLVGLGGVALIARKRKA